VQSGFLHWWSLLKSSSLTPSLTSLPFLTRLQSSPLHCCFPDKFTIPDQITIIPSIAAFLTRLQSSPLHSYFPDKFKQSFNTYCCGINVHGFCESLLFTNSHPQTDVFILSLIFINIAFIQYIHPYCIIYELRMKLCPHKQVKFWLPTTRTPTKKNDSMVYSW
jgi:hypothetical protein